MKELAADGGCAGVREPLRGLRCFAGVPKEKVGLELKVKLILLVEVKSSARVVVRIELKFYLQYQGKMAINIMKPPLRRVLLKARLFFAVL